MIKKNFFTMDFIVGVIVSLTVLAVVVYLCYVYHDYRLLELGVGTAILMYGSIPYIIRQIQTLFARNHQYSFPKPWELLAICIGISQCLFALKLL